jgi:oxygen-independent coproporphyrinogen-3 oxidase
MVADPPSPLTPSGIYVHIPVCSRRCSYCDFATVAGRDHMVEGYLAALRTEISLFQNDLPGPVDSVFIGGGTPSRLSGDRIRSILDALRSSFQLLPNAEVTKESNPEDLDPGTLADFLEAGVNRLTVGVQSLDPDVLRNAGRGHDGDQALQAVRSAVQAGFGQVGIDLIAGLPGEDPGNWIRTLERLAEPGPDHVSVYLLETDKNTPLTRAIRDGRVEEPGDDQQADAWERTVDTLAKHGFRQYEISNFGRITSQHPDGAVCRHNLKYWNDTPFAAFGLGAHRYIAGCRRANTRDLDQYVQCLEQGQDPSELVEAWDPVRRLEEALFMGLRLNAGVDLVALGGRYGLDLERMFSQVWENGEKAGLLDLRAGRVRLTRSGMLRSNQVFGAIVGHLEV